MDLTETEDIKKRWQEYTVEVHKKDLHNPDKHYGGGVALVWYDLIYLAKMYK